MARKTTRKSKEDDVLMDFPPRTVLPTFTETQLDVDVMASKVTSRIMDELKAYLPIIARLANADTIHSMERPETVLRRAIAEGRQAAEMLKEV